MIFKRWCSPAKITLIFIILLFSWAASGYTNAPPGPLRGCMDQAGIFADIQDGCSTYLDVLRENYGIDAVIISLGELPKALSIEETALNLFLEHDIGKDFNGNGLLLLFSKEEKLARIEVSYSLEDVFTDLFCGYAQDRQLRHYFLSDDIEFGLIAVMEEIEKRAAVKMKGRYTPQVIEQMDSSYLSGGAGAGRNLSALDTESFKHQAGDYPAGSTPEEAFDTLVRSWKHKVRNPNLGVYTEVAKITFENFTHQPDSAYEENVKHFDKAFLVIRNQSHAVIHFNRNTGWDNTPFLFARTSQGWRFDMVNQLKHVRMSRNPKWGIEAGNYIYTTLLKRFPTFGEHTRDIPLAEKDIYRIGKDPFIAQQIRHYQYLLEKEPENPKGLKTLGRLYALTAHRKAVKTLKNAIRLNPNDAESHKYLSIVLFDGHLEEKGALKYINHYRKQVPTDPFGASFAGYLYYRLNDLSTAEKLLKHAVFLDPSRSYPYCYLARIYAQKYSRFLPIDPRRISAKKKLKGMVQLAQTCDAPHPHRISALHRFLKKQKIALDMK